VSKRITLTRWRSLVDPRVTRLHTTWEEWFTELSKPAILWIAWDEKEQRDIPDKQSFSGWIAATFAGDHLTKNYLPDCLPVAASNEYGGKSIAVLWFDDLCKLLVKKPLTLSQQQSLFASVGGPK
jgi:hypothetical protein